MTTHSRENIQDIYPLSPMQAGMFFHALYNPDSRAYFEQMSYRIQGHLDIDQVRKSFTELIKRYDILRTVFIQKNDNEPLQVVLKDAPVDISFHDKTDSKEIDIFIQNYQEEDKVRSFDIGKDILMRLAIIKVAEKEYEFIWTNHHILMDGWCRGILIADFYEIYEGLVKGTKSKTRPIRQYKEFINWSQQQDRTKAAKYWSGFLKGYKHANSIPFTKNYGEKVSYDSRLIEAKVDANVTANLDALARKHHTTLNSLVQVAWGILLGKYNCQNDVVFGSVVAVRPPVIPGIEAMVGLFINAIPVRIRFNEQMNVSDLLEKTISHAVESKAFDYYPLSEIQSASHLRANLLDHILVFENYPLAEEIEALNTVSEEKRIFQVSNLEAFEQTNYDFNVIIFPGGEQLAFKFGYNGNLYDDSYVVELFQNLNEILTIMSQNIDITIKELSLSSHDPVLNSNRFSEEFVKNQKEILSEHAFSEIGALREAIVANDDRSPVILDEHAKVLPVGSKGEIFLGRRKDLPENGKVNVEGLSNADLVKTDQMGYWLPDGNIQYVGKRIPDAVIMGKGVSVTELSNALTSHTNIAHAHIYVLNNQPNIVKLIAFYSSKDGQEIKDLNDYLKDLLPVYLIPSRCIGLTHEDDYEQGTVDEKTLQAWYAKYTQTCVSDFDKYEEEILSIWKTVLEVENLHLDDNFFELGGTSIKVLRIYGAIKKIYPERITVADLFDQPTIAMQAELIKRSFGKEESQSDKFEVIDF